MRTLGLLLSALLCLGLAPAAVDTRLVRDERAVSVQGMREVWRLVWAAKPRPLCPETDVVSSITCPCSGWAYGEQGDLFLVRMRGGREVDRLRLGPLFGRFDAPGDAEDGDVAYLQRWPRRDRDHEREARGDPALVAEVHHRSSPQVIQPADYNHDGQATEFLIQVGTLPCGKHQYAAVGVTKDRPTLHALGSKAHPNEPLTMPLQAWRALLRSPTPKPVLIWDCDDHGSEVQSMLDVSAAGGVIRAVDRDYGCPSQGNAGKLIREAEW